eukprot:gene21885-22872_t
MARRAPLCGPVGRETQFLSAEGRNAHRPNKRFNRHMIQPEWGTKRTCPKCATRFYDLGKEDPVTCINCGAHWEPEPILKSKQPLPFEQAKPELVKKDDDLAGDDEDIDTGEDEEPSPDDEVDPARRDRRRRALTYMGLEPGRPLEEIGVDVVFIGSCTNSRIEDLRAAASVAAGRHVMPGVKAIIVPGSGLVRAQAEREGLAQIFLDAGFEWRQPGCSMCVGMNGDSLAPGQRCASTSNRNFEGRQGVGGRTHLMSPAMAAAAAITGRLTDVRKLNIDTDAIYPARFLLLMDREGLGDYLFHDWRFDRNGKAKGAFVLDTEPFSKAQILIAGPGFGCGSSREQAVWALTGFGIRCVIAPSFGEIFAGNATKNGLLTITLPVETVQHLSVAAQRGARFRIDL